MTEIKEIKYVSDNSKLMSEWCWEKNTNINPARLTIGSHKKVWWKCKNGHEWEAIVSNRARLGRSCPYCTRQKVLVGENDLCTTHPELVKEWNYSKNGSDKPEQFMRGSHKKVWWICAKGHEWQAQINSRCNGVGCPYCANKKVLVGVNDLSTIYPKISAEWHPTKNGDLTPKDVTFGSGKKVWWKCKNGHEWEAVVCNRIKGRGCPICSARRRTSFPEQAIFYYVKKAFPDAKNGYKDIFSQKSMEIDIYIPSIKVGIEFDGKLYHTSDNNRVRDARKYQICKNNGIKLIRITDNLNTEMIINCDHKIEIPSTSDYYLNIAISHLLYKLNRLILVDIANDRMKILDYLTSTDLSLESEFPHIAKEWNYEKNEGLIPSMFHPGSNEKVWWKCSDCGKEWKTSISERTGRDKTNCPKCAKEIGAKKHQETVLKQKGSIAETHPYLLEEWDYSKNDISPQKITAGSGVKVWWICKKCGYNWQTTPGHRTQRKSGCPCCRNLIVVAGINDMATTHPQLLNEWDYGKNILIPTEIVAGTSRKAWWKCSVCGHEWEAAINTRKNGAGCPSCAIERRRKNINGKKVKL